uniref:L-fucose mutarotase n=2 Tax=Plectus sambesii TaxID=2011161 RepID=A0A914UJ14_9BILA
MGLKGIPKIISPELLQVLSAMGHGDEIVLADIHFPSASICRNGPTEIRADGHSIPNLLEGILHLFPLDTYVSSPAAIMQKTPQDKDLHLPNIEKYQQLLAAAEKRDILIEEVERFAFYQRAKKAFAVVHSGDTAKYGNIILTKGLVQYD